MSVKVYQSSESNNETKSPTKPNEYQHASGKKYKKKQSRIQSTTTDRNAKPKKCRVESCINNISTQTTTKTHYCNVHKCGEYKCHRLRRATGLCTSCNQNIFNNINLYRSEEDQLIWPQDLPNCNNDNIDYCSMDPYYITTLRAKTVQNIAYNIAEQDYIKKQINLQCKNGPKNDECIDSANISGCVCGMLKTNGNCKFLYPSDNWIGCDNPVCERFYHVSCLQLTHQEYQQLVKLKWFCPICTNHLPYFQKGYSLPLQNIIEAKPHTPVKKPLNLKRRTWSPLTKDISPNIINVITPPPKRKKVLIDLVPDGKDNDELTPDIQCVKQLHFEEVEDDDIVTYDNQKFKIVTPNDLQQAIDNEDNDEIGINDNYELKQNEIDSTNRDEINNDEICVSTTITAPSKLSLKDQCTQNKVAGQSNALSKQRMYKHNLQCKHPHSKQPKQAQEQRPKCNLCTVTTDTCPGSCIIMQCQSCKQNTCLQCMKINDPENAVLAQWIKKYYCVSCKLGNTSLKCEYQCDECDSKVYKTINGFHKHFNAPHAHSKYYEQCNKTLCTSCNKVAFDKDNINQMCPVCRGDVYQSDYIELSKDLIISHTPAVSTTPATPATANEDNLKF